MAFDHFYDAQLRRYVLQFMRIFHEIKISKEDENGNIKLETLPIRWGAMERTAAHALRENSENVVLPGNLMAATIQDISLSSEYRKNPSNVDKLTIDEREYNAASGEYGGDIGRRYSIDRYMPTALEMTMRLDILTATADDKMQVLEQIMMIFNPGITIQHTDNPVDYSAFFNVELDNIDWSSRSIGTGDDERDYSTLTFTMYPVWINPPAKVKRRNVIEQIVTNLVGVQELPDDELLKFSLDPITNCFDRLDQFIVTPNNHQFKIGMDGVATDEIMLLNENGGEDEELDWKELIQLYGEYDEELSYIVIKTKDDIEDDSGDIYANFMFDDTRTNIINITVDEDTLPSTISSGPVDAVIDPLRDYPSNDLPAAAAGQRYLIVNDIPQNTGSNPWGSVGAREGDIIQYNGFSWITSEDSSEFEEDVYVRSLANNELYKYDVDRGEWINALRFQLHPGYLRIVITKCD